MRKGSRRAACLAAMLCAMGAQAIPPDQTGKTVSPPPVLDAPNHVVKPSRVLSFRSLEAQVDNQVVANLLTDAPSRPNEIPLSVVAGRITRCESETCVVPLTVRVTGADGPVRLTFAVASPKGELSDVHHAECGTGACSVALTLERGNNTVSIGVLDGLSSASAYSTVRVNADRAYAKAGRTEWF